MRLEDINQIVEELDTGFNCYWNLHTNELVFIPANLDSFSSDTEVWDELLENITKTWEKFEIIEKPDSDEAFKIMAAFAGGLTSNHHLQTRLIDALNNKKPFSNFKHLIDNSGPYREEWFAFKKQCLEEYVRTTIQRIKQARELPE